MSRPDLTPFSYVILSLVGTGGAGAHDLRRMMLSGGRIYWAAGESLFYSEPKRLTKLGYLSAQRGPGKTRDRTHYDLTEQGVEALRVWAATPSGFPRIQNEAVVKVMSADIAGDEAVLAGVQGLRADLDDLSHRLDEVERSAEDLPHRARYLRINHRYARRLIEVHEEWVDEIEREIQTQEGRAVRGGR